MEGPLVLRDPHPLPPPTGGGLDHHRKADIPCDLQSLVGISHDPLGAQHHGHAHLHHGLAGSGLVTHGPDLTRRGADEDDVDALADLRELRVLRQEAVSGVNRLGAGHFGGGDDPGDVQIALGGRRRADAHILVREAYVERFPVRFRIHRHGLNTQLVAGPDDAKRDFTAIRDQQLLEQRLFSCDDPEPIPLSIRSRMP